MRSGHRRALIAILLLAAALRLHHLSVESLWLDEAYSVQISRGPLSHIVAATSLDVHPPLYYFVLHYWMKLATDSEFGARLLSLVLSLGSILLTYRFAARVLTPASGLAAAALLAVSPFQIEFAQEARMYALLALLGAASTYCFVALFSRRRAPWLAAYVVVTTMMMYTQIHGVFVIAGQAIALAAQFVIDRRAFRRAAGLWAAAQAIGLALFSPWISVLREQASRVQHGFWIPKLPWVGVLEPFYTYSGSPMLVGVIVISACYGGWRLWIQRSVLSTAPAALAVLLSWMIAPILLPFLLSQIGSPIFLPKYTIAASIPFALFAGHGIAGLPNRRLPWAVIALVFVLSAPTLANYYGVMRKNDWRGVSARLEAEAQPGDLVLFYRGFDQQPFDYYRRRTDLVERPFPLESEHPTPAVTAEVVRAATENRSRVWLVLLDIEPLRADIMTAFGEAYTRVDRGVWTHVELDLFIKQR